MVKQKIVMKVSWKLKQKAIEIVAGQQGIRSLSVKGETIEVEGDGIDLVELMTKIRKKTGIKKKMGSADLVSFGEKKEEKKVEKDPVKNEENRNTSYAHGVYSPQPHYMYYI